MTLSLSKKNALSVMTMTLTMISLISPADAQTRVFSQAIGGFLYTCHVDTNKNPLPDCLNSMAAICDTTRTSFNKITCQTGVNQMFASMGTHWQNVRKECGQWPFTQNGISSTGVYPSAKCATANSNLIANGFYIQNGIRVPVTPSMTESFNQNLWSQTVLKDIVTTAAKTPDCFWVVESWKKMGGTTSASSTNATACCNYIGSTTQTSGIPGVNCTSAGSITHLNWWDLGLVGQIPSQLGNLTNLLTLNLGYNWLSGSIPPEIGNLKKLQYLDLYYNELTGSIPSSLGNLVELQYLGLASQSLSGSIPPSLGNLKKLEVFGLWGNHLNGSIPSWLANLTNLRSIQLGHNQLTGPIPSSLENLVKLEAFSVNDNQGLNGTFTHQCETTSGVEVSVSVSGTNITICGCAAASSPPAIYPPPETHADCLASVRALTLAKRTQASGQVIAEIGAYKYTCHVDLTYKNPFADCTNSMAFLCNTSDTTWNLDGAKRERCRTAVNKMYGQMNTHWQEVRKECGQWSWNSSPAISAAASSANCATANNNLIANAFYTQKDLSRVYITPGFTISQNDGLWSKVTEQ